MGPGSTGALMASLGNRPTCSPSPPGGLKGITDMPETRLLNPLPPQTRAQSLLYREGHHYPWPAQGKTLGPFPLSLHSRHQPGLSLVCPEILPAWPMEGAWVLVLLTPMSPEGPSLASAHSLPACLTHTGLTALPLPWTVLPDSSNLSPLLSSGGAP